MNRTLQSLRQRIFAALTSPLLTYTVNDGSPQTLPAANVQPKAVWEVGKTAPMPLVCFTVEGRESPVRAFNERVLRLKLWVVSESGQSECSELYEAVRAILHLGDSESVPDGPANLSRKATGTTLALGMRECIETRVSGVDYERETNRWYLVAEYRIVAV